MDIPSLFMIPSAVSSGKVHSVFPNSTDADFDFNRDSDATRVNSEGLIERVGYYGSELVSNGNFNDSSFWSVGQYWSIANGLATRTVVGSELNYSISKSSLLVIGKTYRVDITVHSVQSGNVKVVLGATNGEEYTEAGTYTFVGTCTTNTNFKISPSNDFNGSIDSVSVKEVTGDRARLNYEIEGGLVNTKPSLLLEPQSTNLITYSEDYSQSSWNKLNAQVSRTVVTSPDGNNTNVFNLTGTNGNLYVGGTTGVQYTISVYIKSNNKNKDKFKLRLGNNISSEYEATNEWKRYIFTSTPTTGVLGITTSSSPDNEFDLLVWGFQLEQLSYATSYIPTNGSTQTRAAETCNGAGTSSILPSEEGILYAEIAALASSDSTNPNRNIAISDGTSNNTAIFYYQSSTNRLSYIIIVGGSVVASGSVDTYTVTNFNKIALKWKQNNFCLYVNATKVFSDTSGSSYSSGTLNTVNFDGGSGGDDFYGKIRDIRVYNTKEMTDSEVDILLTKITS